MTASLPQRTCIQAVHSKMKMSVQVPPQFPVYPLATIPFLWINNNFSILFLISNIKDILLHLQFYGWFSITYVCLGYLVGDLFRSILCQVTQVV